MIRWLRSLFAWDVVSDTGCVVHMRNAITGAEKRFRYAGLGPVEPMPPGTKPPHGGGTGKR